MAKGPGKGRAAALDGRGRLATMHGVPNIDPRPAVVARRLADIRRVLAVASGKGGVGKTTCATLAALLCARSGLRTTLFDLDFHGSSCHTVLGHSPGLPQESGGILPVSTAGGLELVSIASFTGERPVPLRGPEASSALAEVLAATVWGERDLLIVDMPPGMGDLLLDMVRLAPRVEVLLVTTASRVVRAVVSRLVALLSETSVPLAGVVLNMTRDGQEAPDLGWGMPLLGSIPFDPDLERALGDPEALVATAAARALDAILKGVLGCRI